MGFIRRVRNIVTANVYDLLDRCENPESLLEQAIRDMEESLRMALTAAAKVVANEHILARQHADAERDAAAWRRQAESAVSAGDDDRARQALRRQRDQQQLAEMLAVERQEASTASRKLRRQLESLRLRLYEARRQRDMLIARQRAAEARRHLLHAACDLPIDDRGFQEFERMSRKLQQAEAEAEALTDLTVSTFPDETIARECETDAWIERELSALKERKPE